jgi:hypothetical protein
MYSVYWLFKSSDFTNGGNGRGESYGCNNEYEAGILRMQLRRIVAMALKYRHDYIHVM